MNGTETVEAVEADADVGGAGTDLSRLLGESSARTLKPEQQFVTLIGELIGIGSDGRVPLVTYSGSPGAAAVGARTVVDLHGAHIGCSVVLTFEAGDPAKPIVIGLLRERDGWPLADQPGQVEIDADGERLIITAKEQIVLRCGKASITLTKAGKVLIRGSYIMSRSSGANRIKGGSVQLN